MRRDGYSRTVCVYYYVCMCVSDGMCVYDGMCVLVRSLFSAQGSTSVARLETPSFQTHDTINSVKLQYY